jgi:hypothetical protein
VNRPGLLLRWARALVRASLPPLDREGIAAELEDVHAERLARSGRLRADLWYLRQAGGFLVRVGLPRWTGPGSDFASDMRITLRTLLRTPGFASLVVLTLALGIGANTAIFSVVDHLLIRDLPYPDAERLVLLFETPPGEMSRNTVRTADWLDWQRESRGFESLAAWGAGESSWGMNVVGATYRWV